MAFLMDDNAVGGQFICGAGVPKALGLGKTRVRGSAYVEGPLQAGVAGDHNTIKATLMVGKLANIDVKDFGKIIYSLWVRTHARFQNFVRVDTLIKSPLIEARVVRTEYLQAKVKNFCIDHPTKENKKLVYTCLEGPENGVYVRGQLLNSNVIELPDYWTNLVHQESISVSITPFGNHQDIIVKDIKENQIYLEEKSDISIHCFYHVFATRKDVPELITEIDQ